MLCALAVPLACAGRAEQSHSGDGTAGSVTFYDGASRGPFADGSRAYGDGARSPAMDGSGFFGDGSGHFEPPDGNTYFDDGLPYADGTYSDGDGTFGDGDPQADGQPYGSRW